MPEQLTTLSPLNLTTEAQKTIEDGRTAYLFGAFLDPLVELGIKHIANGTMDQKNVGLALLTIAQLYRFSGEAYEKQPEKLTGDALLEHQRNVLNGDIILVAPPVEMNEENRVTQLQRANEAFSKLPPAIQAVVA